MTIGYPTYFRRFARPQRNVGKDEIYREKNIWTECSLFFAAKSVIDNKPPQTYMHLHLKLKKLQIEEERLAEVERENRILLEKISYIMRTKVQPLPRCLSCLNLNEKK